jgi:hypothetical protein
VRKQTKEKEKKSKEKKKNKRIKPYPFVIASVIPVSLHDSTTPYSSAANN